MRWSHYDYSFYLAGVVTSRRARLSQRVLYQNLNNRGSAPEHHSCSRHHPPLCALTDGVNVLMRGLPGLKWVYRTLIDFLSLDVVYTSRIYLSVGQKTTASCVLSGGFVGREKCKKVQLTKLCVVFALGSKQILVILYSRV